MAQTSPYGVFLDERSLILRDIKGFLNLVLHFQHEYEKRAKPPSLNNAEDVRKLIKSLCLIHALYGYPGNEEETKKGKTRKKSILHACPFYCNSYYLRILGVDLHTSTLHQTFPALQAFKTFLETPPIDKDAVKDFVEQNKIGGKNLLDFFQLNDTLWEVECPDLESLPREPAYIFVEMIRPLYSNPTDVIPCWLQRLHPGNLLRPRVWAKHRENKDLCGVSLGSPKFLRPLYLYTKLWQLRTGNSQDIHLEDVKAYKLDKLCYIPPCTTCQRSFVKFSSPMIGNCAEYDVIGKVDLTLLPQDQWEKLESASEQHLRAFNTMKSNIENEISPEEIIKEYFESTCDPIKPKVLRYQWSAETKGGFKVITEDWVPTE